MFRDVDRWLGRGSGHVLIALIVGTGCGEDPGLPLESHVPENVPGHLAQSVCQASSDCCELPRHVPACEDPRPAGTSLAAGLDAALAANLTWDKRPFYSWLPECNDVVANGSVLERGMWFVSCAPGLACFPDGVCRVGQSLGDACTEAEPCAAGWCDESTNTCVADLPDDSPCEDHVQCASEYCWEGACYAAPTQLCGRWGW